MKLGAIAKEFQLELRGDPETEISGIAGLKDAGPGQLTFLFNSGYRQLLGSSQAAAVVLRESDAAATDKPVLFSENP